MEFVPHLFKALEGCIRVEREMCKFPNPNMFKRMLNFMSENLASVDFNHRAASYERKVRRQGLGDLGWQAQSRPERSLILA